MCYKKTLVPIAPESKHLRIFTHMNTNNNQVAKMRVKMHPIACRLIKKKVHVTFFRF